MTDQDLPGPAAPTGATPEPASWAQPPAASARAAGWAQPPGSAPRRLYGSTEAKRWQANEELAARAEAATLADRADAATAGLSGVLAQGYAPVRTFTPTVQRCPRCGGNIDFDGYCESCGAKAPSVREHFEETPAPWVAGVCDRGIRHPINEDALALDASPVTGGRAVLVVCDGVSMSADSEQASLAAARATVGFVAGRGDWTWDLADLAPKSRTRALIAEAAQVANQAVLDHSDLSQPSPASCTWAVGMVAGRQLLAATLGDSRVYWLPDHGAALLLSTDHSVAQEQIAAGTEREIAESGIHAHIITRWLGRDAPDTTPSISGTLAEGAGWLLVCSDGLWNYASDPEAMHRLVGRWAAPDDPDPLELARALVVWANEQGGHDNITVALARIDEPPAAEPAAPTAASVIAEELETPTTRTRPVARAASTPAG